MAAIIDEMRRGDDYNPQLAVASVDNDGVETAVDITTWTLHLDVYLAGVLLDTYGEGTGLTIDDPTTGVIDVLIPSADTTTWTGNVELRLRTSVPLIKHYMVGLVKVLMSDD